MIKTKYIFACCLPLTKRESFSLILGIKALLDGAIGGALDLQFTGREFKSWLA